ncbi:MAG: hypothetical protein V3U85_01895, partial [Hyphomicrobium sp.]
AVLLAMATAATLAGRRKSKAASHVWTLPGLQGVLYGFGFLVGCGHVFGPLLRLNSDRWP